MSVSCPTCHHLHPTGNRCGSPALRGEQFCFFHHPTRRPPYPHTRLSRTPFGRTTYHSTPKTSRSPSPKSSAASPTTPWTPHAPAYSSPPCKWPKPTSPPSPPTQPKSRPLATACPDQHQVQTFQTCPDFSPYLVSSQPIPHQDFRTKSRGGGGRGPLPLYSLAQNRAPRSGSARAGL